MMKRKSMLGLIIYISISRWIYSNRQIEIESMIIQSVLVNSLLVHSMIDRIRMYSIYRINNHLINRTRIYFNKLDRNRLVNMFIYCR